MFIAVSLLALACAVAALTCALRERRAARTMVRELQRQVEEAREIVRTRGALASEVAHEIKNPITAVLCSAETLDLLIGDRIEPEHRKSLQYIMEYGDHILRLLSDYLDLSRSESGCIDLVREPVPLPVTVDGVIGLLASYAMRRNIEVAHLTDESECRAFADRRMVKQIAFNLLHNAIKFSPAGSAVTVLERVDERLGRVYLTVADQGPGIPRELLPHIFDPYVQHRGGAASRLHRDTGAGLGLALVRQLVGLLGGEIEAHSVAGSGTTFEVWLPLADPQEAPSVELSWQDGGRADGGFYKPLLGQSFLVVDDDAGARDAVARLIEAWGGMVDQVAFAADALTALSQKSYDAVMVDDASDGITGVDLARTLREEGRGETTIILATREGGDPEVRERSRADQLIEKPFNGNVLLHSLLNSGRSHPTH